MIIRKCAQREATLRSRAAADGKERRTSVHKQDALVRLNGVARRLNCESGERDRRHCRGWRLRRYRRCSALRRHHTRGACRGAVKPSCGGQAGSLFELLEHITHGTFMEHSRGGSGRRRRVAKDAVAAWSVSPGPQAQTIEDAVPQHLTREMRRCQSDCSAERTHQADVSYVCAHFGKTDVICLSSTFRGRRLVGNGDLDRAMRLKSKSS